MTQLFTESLLLLIVVVLLLKNSNVGLALILGDMLNEGTRGDGRGTVLLPLLRGSLLLDLLEDSRDGPQCEVVPLDEEIPGPSFPSFETSLEDAGEVGAGETPVDVSLHKRTVLRTGKDLGSSVVSSLASGFISRPRCW